MATLALTNQKAAQALDGQGVRVTLSWAQANANLPLIEAGMRCETGSPIVTGYVASVDKLGYSFLVNPAMPDIAFATSPGYLMNAQTVNVYTT